MPSNRSLNLCPASIREGQLANIGHLFCTVIDSPSKPKYEKRLQRRTDLLPRRNIFACPE